MDDNKTINFSYSRIITEEFAITEEIYDPAKDVQMKFNLNFNFLAGPSAVTVRVKCFLYQEHRLLSVIAVACWFTMREGEWHSRLDKTAKTFWLHREAALYLANLTVSTARGVLHGKTEHLPVNEVVLPTINIDELIKEDVLLTTTG